MTLTLSGCCSRPKPESSTIVVEKSEIVSNPDGSYTVNKAWMLKRLEQEKRLMGALEQCLGEDR
jgi:hypothetical protein